MVLLMAVIVLLLVKLGLPFGFSLFAGGSWTGGVTAACAVSGGKREKPVNNAKQRRFNDSFVLTSVYDKTYASAIG